MTLSKWNTTESSRQRQHAVRPKIKCSTPNARGRGRPSRGEGGVEVIWCSCHLGRVLSWPDVRWPLLKTVRGTELSGHQPDGFLRSCMLDGWEREEEAEPEQFLFGTNQEASQHSGYSGWVIKPTVIYIAYSGKALPFAMNHFAIN